ncbi:MAG: hypothetical protein K2P35_02030 [Lachnospiraceae bacterium]|jgi:hypothetical protein|nr:hypothetical protein [Lachnospiraceae bacterium]
MGETFHELNEMQLLERNIIKSYNELLKTLWEEGDMDTLGRVIMDDSYRNVLLEMHTGKLREGHEI